MDLRFDPETHRSFLPNGTEVPHVTSILSDMGMSEDFEGLGGISPRLASRIDYRRQLGTAVHADCHAYDDNDLDLNLSHPSVRPFVDAWITCRDQEKLTPVVRERQVYHPTLRYTGILDGIFERPNDRRVLLDLKIGDPTSAAADLQTAAYLGAWLGDGVYAGDSDIERWSVWLRPDTRKQYEIRVYRDHVGDWGIWSACVAVYHEKKRRRG